MRLADPSGKKSEQRLDDAEAHQLDFRDFTRVVDVRERKFAERFHRRGERGSFEQRPILRSRKQRVFAFLEKYGHIAHREMFNIFNMGIGMVIAMEASQADEAVSLLAGHGLKASVIGRVTDTEGVVIR